MHVYARNAVGRGLAALAILAAIVGTGVLTTSAEPAAHADRGVARRLHSAETADARVAVIVADVTSGIESPDEFSVPVAICSLDPHAEVTLNAITVADPKGDVITTEPRGARPVPAPRVPRSAATIVAQLAGVRSSGGGSLAREGTVFDRVNVATGQLALQDGETATLTVTASVTVDGRPYTTSARVFASVAALPTLPSWALGDGHVHSSTWSDGWEALAWQVSDAKNAGHKWIIMTDHWKGIWAKSGRGNENWGLYIDDCASMESRYGLPVVPATEIMASANQGHALAYALSRAKVPPRDEYFAPFDLVDAITSHTPGSSFAVIAHPYSVMADVWGDWRATGFRAIELMSQERQASQETQDTWFSLLRTGLASRISGGGFVVGVANTDAHLTWQRPGESGSTWVRSTASPLTGDAVLQAIRNGAVSASGREDLGNFTLNGVQQGGTAAVTASSRLNFVITQKPVTGRKCTEITIRNNNNVAVWSVRNPSAGTSYPSLPAPTTDTFYVVKMVFARTDDSDYSHVWCNPVFVDRR